MNRIYRTILIWGILGLLGISSPLAAREPIDKSGYLKSCWLQANPWFPPNKSRLIAPLGGPNYAMKRYSDNGWLEVFKQLHSYGVTGIQYELVGDGYWESFLEVLEAAQASDTGMYLSVFSSLIWSTYDENRDALKRMFERLNPVLREHPNVFRLDGRPIIIIYQAALLQPEEWTRLIDELEAEYGAAVWLFSSFDGGKLYNDAEAFRGYLEVFDGISNYCNFSDAGQREHYAMVAPIMRENPEKIFEAGVHNAYMSHFHNGGQPMNLSEKFRNSWTIALGVEPDAVALTNLFDHYENSLFLPCYEREDFLLRYSRLQLEKWRGVKPQLPTEPEFFLTSDINLRLGENLELELIYWPIDHAVTDASVTVEWCAPDGRVLHAFAPRPLDLRESGSERFSLAAPWWVAEMAVTPRARLYWNGQEKIFAPHMNTIIQPTMRANNMYWARSNRNQLLTAAQQTPEWTLNGAGPGAKIAWDDGLGVFRGMVAAVANQNIDQLRIMRNGREFATIEKSDLMFEHALPLPSPGECWDTYHLELENRDGFRYQTDPIFVTTHPEQTCDVAIPVLRADGTIIEADVDGRRLTDFSYPMDRDDGVLLIDRSGFQHHGYLGGGGFGGGHLKFTGYRFEHSGTVEPLPSAAAPQFGRDADGTGYLRFDGSQYISMMGATLPPYALTVELEVRPKIVGAAQTILATGNRQLKLHLDAEGRLHASRATQGATGEEIVSVSSREALAPGEWHQVSVHYDLQNLTLTVDGQMQESKTVAPQANSIWHNFMLLGCGIANFWDPAEHYTGDLRRLKLNSY